MEIGFIGSGRVGVSLGKYLSDHGIRIVGYYNRHEASAAEAARFTDSDCFSTLEELVERSDTLFVTTPDDEIAGVWDRIRKMSIEHKMICHCSGSLSSNVFQGIEAAGASAVSVHPLLAFSSRFESHEQLHQAFFAVEGNEKAVEAMRELFVSLGNRVQVLDTSVKTKYHCAASILSNQVIAVLDTGYRLLEECGFDREDARQVTKGLVLGNVKHVIAEDCALALTGPIERGDTATVEKHLSCLSREDAALYRLLGKRLIEIARGKHPGKHYEKLEELLS